MFHRWQQVPSNTTEYVHLTEDLLTSCYRIEWKLAELEKTISVASRDPAYLLDELELSRRREWIGSARYQVGAIKSAVKKGMSKSARQKLMGASSTNNDAYIISESDRQVLNMWQQDDEITCVVLDEKATMEAMKVISSAVLTMIAALSSYSAEKVAPLAHRKLTQELLLISPYVCIPVALSGVIFSFCASKSNGLAECATAAVLFVCLFGIALGASAAAIMLHVAHRSALLLNNVLMIALICAWGWLFNNPRCLKFFMWRLYWECFIAAEVPILGVQRMLIQGVVNIQNKRAFVRSFPTPLLHAEGLFFLSMKMPQFISSRQFHPRLSRQSVSSVCGRHAQ